MEKYNQWEAEPGHELDVPLKYRRMYRYKVLYRVEGQVVTAWCRKYKVSRYDVELTDVMVNTSDRACSILLKKRMTYWPRYIIVSTPVLIYDLGVEEVLRFGD